MTSPKIERALISVSDKTGLIEFAKGLVAAGVEIFASGGTRQHLEQAGIPVHEVAAYTGFPEMMDGRIKTLHPKIHAGILCRRDRPDDMAAIAEQGIVPFELVVVNLYPFRQTILEPEVKHEDAIENIDIGGPTLIRAAAKNHEFVTVSCDPQQYDGILEQIRVHGETAPEFREALAGSAFFHTGFYDMEIAEYFRRRNSAVEAQFRAVSLETDGMPHKLDISLNLKELLRYGENPHQHAAVYATSKASRGALI
ncbi:MAG TPA: bifunctional phosphoribosylaminoimidazolecarboxamide formyltransferase/IMP cyclohydrolase, partial [Lacipirellulaceae bacterium]|nr:bifunctional phosphoribosylaminoimidazolecarboxamide formyltransferase/IMP cyclohydrolase [Lacipirellulaceae bacterium]